MSDWYKPKNVTEARRMIKETFPGWSWSVVRQFSYAQAYAILQKHREKHYADR